MRLLQITLALLVATSTSGLFAQTGIGTFNPDPNFALHVKANGNQEPLKLEGLRQGSGETSVIVTDANGGLRYRPAADLFSGGSSLWVNNSNDISPESNRSVGIGQTSVDNSLILGVTGNQRMSNTSQIQFSDNQNFIYAQSANQLYFVGRQEVSFRDRNNTTELLTVRADNGRIGLFNRTPNVDFEVSGTQQMTGDERLQFRDGTNYINSPGSNNNWYFHGQQYVVFRDRNDAVDILTIQANTDRVGILNRNPQVDFEVSGTQRMTGTNHLELGSTFNHIYARNNQDLRINGFTETNFMNRAETTAVLSIDANTERIGVRTNNPDATLHIDPSGLDFPIRIEDIPIASVNTTYRRLIINDDGYVYRSRTTVDRNGLTDNKNQPEFLRQLTKDKPSDGLIAPTGVQAHAEDARAALQAENMELRIALQESQEQQREAMLILEAKLAALTNKIDMLYSETGAEK